MHSDSREAAEAFIDKVIVPRRLQPRDAEEGRRRRDLARKERELVKREIAEAGFDADRLDKLAAKGSDERKKLAEEDHRRSVEASAAAARRLLDIAPVILPLDPVDTVIDQVTFIRSFAGQGAVLESNIAPGDNWARYRMESTDDAWDGTGRLSFFTLWQNQRNAPTVLMARPNLVVNARLSCSAEWNGTASWFGFSSEGRGSVRARTTVWGMDSSISSIVHDEALGAASARGGFFGDDSSDTIEFNEVLSASGVTIAPQAFSLIEVELLTEWHAASGSVTLDAESGSRRVTVPQIILSQVQSPEPPPISLVAGVDYETSPATVTLIFGGANGAMVDIYKDGVRLGDTENDGSWSFKFGPGTYKFRVCERLSSVCSNEVTVTVTH